MTAFGARASSDQLDIGADYATPTYYQAYVTAEQKVSGTWTTVATVTPAAGYYWLFGQVDVGVQGAAGMRIRAGSTTVFSTNWSSPSGQILINGGQGQAYTYLDGSTAVTLQIIGFIGAAVIGDGTAPYTAATEGGGKLIAFRVEPNSTTNVGAISSTSTSAISPIYSTANDIGSLTTHSTSFTAVNGLSLTPGAGDYLVVGNYSTNNGAGIDILVNGSTIGSESQRSYLPSGSAVDYQTAETGATLTGSGAAMTTLDSDDALSMSIRGLSGNTTAFTTDSSVDRVQPTNLHAIRIGGSQALGSLSSDAPIHAGAGDTYWESVSFSSSVTATASGTAGFTSSACLPTEAGTYLTICSFSQKFAAGSSTGKMISSIKKGSSTLGTSAVQSEDNTFNHSVLADISEFNGTTDSVTFTSQTLGTSSSTSGSGHFVRGAIYCIRLGPVA